jgi:hypothetical protein
MRGLKVNRFIPAFPATDDGSYICGHMRGFAALAGALSIAKKLAAVQPSVELKRPLGAAPFDLEVSVCSNGLLMVAPNRPPARSSDHSVEAFRAAVIWRRRGARVGRRGVERQRGECAGGRGREGMSLGLGGPE